jgi:hypothetical protein
MRQRAVVAGTVGLTVFGVGGGALPAHAADTSDAIRWGDTTRWGDATGPGLDTLPVAGALPVVPTAVTSPGARMRTEAGAQDLGLVPAVSNVPLIDNERAAALLAKLSGGEISGLGRIGEFARGLGGVALL